MLNNYSTRNKFRIRFSNFLMFLTAIGCITMIISGKNARERGESETKKNQEWHREHNERAAAIKAIKAEV